MRLNTVAMCCLLLSAALFSSPAALADDAAEQARQEQLRQAVQMVGQQPSGPDVPPGVEMCSSPHGHFSPVGVAGQVPFGTRGLAARWTYGQAQAEAKVNISWVYNGHQPPMSTGEVAMGPHINNVTNDILNPEGPLVPGSYSAYFEVGGQQQAVGTITIAPPPPTEGRSAENLYLQGLQALEQAMNHVQAEQLLEAAQAASNALPVLATLMMEMPDEPDPKGFYELAQAVVALGEMATLAEMDAPADVLDWTLRCIAHASAAERLMANADLKKAAGEFADAVESILPIVQEAVTQ